MRCSWRRPPITVQDHPCQTGGDRIRLENKLHAPTRAPSPTKTNRLVQNSNKPKTHHHHQSDPRSWRRFGCPRTSGNWRPGDSVLSLLAPIAQAMRRSPGIRAPAGDVAGETHVQPNGGLHKYVAPRVGTDVVSVPGKPRSLGVVYSTSMFLTLRLALCNMSIGALTLTSTDGDVCTCP